MKIKFFFFFFGKGLKIKFESMLNLKKKKFETLKFFEQKNISKLTKNNQYLLLNNEQKASTHTKNIYFLKNKVN